MTAGHTVINDQSELFNKELLCSKTKILLGYSLSSPDQDLKTLPKENVYSCKRVIERKIRWMKEDYEVIELDREVRGVTPLSFAPMDEIKPGTPVVVMGHPHGLPLKVAGNAQIRGLEGMRFSMNTDAFAGNSGSPILDARSLKVLGVHVSGDFDFTKAKGCKRPLVCEDDKCWGSWGFRPDNY